ncbi:hypothetical protein Trydic_g10319 [Trypoxylus dichotomus]
MTLQDQELFNKVLSDTSKMRTCVVMKQHNCAPNTSQCFTVSFRFDGFTSEKELNKQNALSVSEHCADDFSDCILKGKPCEQKSSERVFMVMASAVNFQRESEHTLQLTVKVSTWFVLEYRRGGAVVHRKNAETPAIISIMGVTAFAGMV